VGCTAQRGATVSIAGLKRPLHPTAIGSSAHFHTNEPPRAPSSGPVASVRAKPTARASGSTSPSHARMPSAPAFARSWNMVRKPAIVAASVT
jgi:hypothetical protein